MGIKSKKIEIQFEDNTDGIAEEMVNIGAMRSHSPSCSSGGICNRKQINW